MKLLMVIPAYNEEDNIVGVVNTIKEKYPEYDYIVVNDGSTDHTSRRCHKHGFEIIDLPVNLGLAGEAHDAVGADNGAVEQSETERASPFAEHDFYSLY